MGVPPYPAMTIAQWFISWAEAGEQELSSQKLQKLLRRAQGHYFARHGRSLLVQPMPAWSHGGLVVPPAERAVKASGACVTGPEDDEVSTGRDVDPATASFLGEVWDTYGGCFADVRLVIPADRRRLPVGGAA